MHQNPNDPATPTIDPPEVQPDIHLPGAERPEPLADPEASLPQRLGERIGLEPSGIAPGESDLLPDVEVPNAQM